MKTGNTKWRAFLTAGALVSLTATVGVAANGDSLNRFSVSGRFLFNISADFMNLSSVADPGPGPGVHGANHNYDDGYVNVDASGNAGNKTWNWGFQNQSSVVGNTLQLQSVRSPTDGTTQSKTDNPQYGFEFSYGRVLKSFDASQNRKLNVGLMGAFGITLLDIQNSTSISGATTGVRDSYDLSGLPMIPNAPYVGSAPTPGGPLPLLIPDSPTSRTPINIPATATEQMKLDGNLYGFKIGPFFELPLGKVISVKLQGGFAALLADGTFSYTETISTGGSSQGSTSKNQWCYGGFVEGQASLALGRNWSVFGGAGFQDVGDYSVTAGTKAAKLHLDSIVSVFTGLDYSF